VTILFFIFLHKVIIIIIKNPVKIAPRLVAQQQRQGFLVFVTWVRASAWMSVTSAVSYLFTKLAGCSVSPGISCGTCKLVRTPRVTKKKKKQVKISKKGKTNLKEQII